MDKEDAGDEKEADKKPADSEASETESTDSEVQAPESSTTEAPGAELETPAPEPSKPEASAPKPSTPESTTPSHTHTWVQTASKDATCSQPGYINEKCDCGATKKTEISATGVHIYGDWVTTVEAAEQNAGLKERACSSCGTKETEEIPMIVPSVPWNEEVLRLVNIERANNGLAPLSYSYNAQSAADVRAAEIIQVFDHTRPNGTSCFTALDETGVSYFTAGENIAYGYPTPQAVVEGWMNSPGHRANILHSGFTQLAVGINGTYWVQLFIG